MSFQPYQDDVQEMDLALRMLARTRRLLHGGNRWKCDKLAADRSGLECDPLSAKAYFFSLVGAAARVRWELREELAEASPGEIRVVDILRAMSADQQTYHSGRLGWMHVETLLDGLENTLREYRGV